ncbi:MAG: T9SS type A sorting domain-containing protein [Bacteroidales bacterium]|jgi:hypothetical protein
MKKIYWLLLFFSLSPLATHADTLTVQPDGTGLWPTIQDAIDNATNGDVVLLADGTYRGIGNRDINTLGKAIVVASESSMAENCVIDCEGTFNVVQRRGFIMSNGEDSTTKIKDITIAYGSTLMACPGCAGAAVFIEYAAPLFENVIFRHNRGGHSVFHAFYADNLILRNCKFYFNTAEFNPCIEVVGNNVLIEKCLFYHNTTAMYNGAIISFDRNTKVVGCTITNNYLNDTWYSSVFTYSHPWGSTPPEGGAIVENTLITNNYTLNVFHHYDSCFPMPLFNHCNHWNNNGNDWTGIISNQSGVEGNLSEDPLYVDTTNMDYHIQYGSPCIDAGNPNSPYDPDETIADIGYYYYDQLTSTAECRADEIKLYPNPSSGIIHFSNFPFHNHEFFNVLIINNSGETVQQRKNVDLRQPIDLSCLPTGFYHCYLQGMSHDYFQKLIIIK